MKLRWSNGFSFAVEFECGRPENMADAMCGALIEYRKLHGEQRIELHVEAGPARWTDPAMQWIASATTPHYAGERCGGYVHVVNCGARVAPDPESETPKTRGTDWVLIVGPGAWHGPEVFRGAIGAIRHYNGIAGLAADVADTVRNLGQEEG
ncbi:MAG: hypothetical protein V2A79_20190 [Planctomycetota bacterium]